MLRRPPRSTLDRSSAASDVYKRQYYISEHADFGESMQIAGALGKMDIISNGMENNKFNWSDKYNIISGLIGGLFLQLSYFGTDQSQVGRYLGGESVKESRLGLLFNGCLLYTSPSPRDRTRYRMPSSACKKNTSQTQNNNRSTARSNDKQQSRQTHRRSIDDAKTT